ncbi:hypothetical protein HBH92_234040 [Parastagonospora nodorum]|nr:hypothetical protein HBH92_234040 [Parastagonospora nodorum]KAH4436550.1 hypothetical protein HBH93_112180 [Parastagonospora nodorum]KAH4438421.1 hypothetical protein HBH91_184400 [Parastagonospora nodorum]KAH4487486.1 hypothetical protein HBH89_199520 [Parastagonospora nodorum]KAH4543159.1 hypothetical protein HBH86_158150 [Parastagonospora nodorum]
MSAGEDDDVKLQRASASLITDFEHILPRLLRKRKHGLVPVGVMHKACSLIEPFQEDPQILDTHLKTFIPPLVDAYLDTLSISSETPQKAHVPLSHAVCCILNTFCKVRGEKVIKGFLSNEPRYLLPILQELEVGRNYRAGNGDACPHEHVVPWVERYILLSWLSHLMLAPFPLASMSGLESSEPVSTLLGAELPAKAPAITLRVLSVCFGLLRSASKERTAAANLLAKLCMRPDMQKLGMLDKLANWSVLCLESADETQGDIHQCLGMLSFLSGLVASTTNDEVAGSLSAIYRACRSLLNLKHLSWIKSSAVARKIIVKILRNIVIHTLHPTAVLVELDSTTVLEEVIEYLLEAVADGDTPVRYGASKALSVITLKLETEMANEVLEAILGSLNESVYWEGSKRNLSGVNALRWHGLTLTLAQLLYRKAIATSRLPEVLNALLLSLSFEQRSPTGGSVGTNVRDSACFGVWALSRRYATSDLLVVDTAAIRACDHRESLSVPQALAIELLTVACLDPAGNIRRGSSAALQELIGRHPDTVEQGIPLVQVVDFHAVGLRQRAMCDVATRVGDLHRLYWEALFDHLLSWRGTGALDNDSRLFAAQALGLLTKTRSPHTVRILSDRVCHEIAKLRPRQVEERQGLVSALAAIINTLSGQTAPRDAPSAAEALLTSKKALLPLWQLLRTRLQLDDKDYTSPALRPELTASSLALFIASIASLTIQLPQSSWPEDVPIANVIHVLNLCLARHEDSVLEAVRLTTPVVISLLSVNNKSVLCTTVCSWLTTLEKESSFNGLRCAGHAIALGSAYPILQGQPPNDPNSFTDIRRRIIEVLTFRCTSAVAVEARTVSLQALTIVVSSSHKLEALVENQIIAALHIALNDYTITERGDVGSLVRTAALRNVGAGWAAGNLQLEGSEVHQKVHADVYRLSLEKLDKIRGVASRILRMRIPSSFEKSETPSEDVSSVKYFHDALQVFLSTTQDTVKEAIILGYVSSAGLGSESVTHNARKALLRFFAALQVDSAIVTSQLSVADVANYMLQLFKSNIDNDRVLLPLLETIAFLFDMRVLQRLVSSSSFNFRSLLSHTQKAHFKSSHMQKLHFALDLYRGLGEIPTTASDTITKVVNMLLHPFPKVRIAAAETLWSLTQLESLKLQDWNLPSTSLKSAVNSVKAELASISDGVS